MNKEKTISILNFYRNIEEEIKLVQKEIIFLEESFYNSVAGNTIDDMPKGNGRISNPTEATTLNMPDWVSGTLLELEREHKQLCELKLLIRKELYMLPYTQRLIVLHFYIEELQWVRISAQMNYSERHCRNIRDSAIVKLTNQFANKQILMDYKFPE